MSDAIVFDGMHGLGDNVHQRAVVRRVLETTEQDIWLRTPWPCLYHDLVGERFHVVPPSIPTLRTQHKNLVRERALQRFDSKKPPRTAPVKKIWYDTPCVRASQSILGGMLRWSLRQPIYGADFTLPVPDAWRAKALARIARPDRPIMVLRPLVDRREWNGCNTRNPDDKAYAALYNAIRSHFFVVSIADLSVNLEWTCGPRLKADVELHAGELDAEAVAGLIASAALTFCSPGFALVLSQAVGTPVVCVYGGRESSPFYDYGARFAPTLGIDPARPCNCFLPIHKCNKWIDLDNANARLAEFIQSNVCEIRRRA
jgi:ADP-heptose:LPS heptosyltransferase